MKLLRCVRLLATPWTAAYQAPPSMGFSRQEYWSGVPLPSPNYIIVEVINPRVFLGGSIVKNPPVTAEDAGLTTGTGRSPGEGNGNPLQYSCLGTPVDRGAWQATVRGSQELDVT